jgi:iduronate 2-sulfatase
LIDLYPTVSELCGLGVPARLQGKSLAKTLDDPAVSVRDTAFCVNHNSFLLRTDKWAYIQHGKNGENGLQLYDMTKDPKQYTNLADHPEHSKIVAGFRKQLAAKLEEVGKNDLDDLKRAERPIRK